MSEVVVVVTGSSSGPGRAIAEPLAGDGARVIVRSSPASARTAARVGVLRNPVIFWQEAHGEPAPERARRVEEVEA